VSAWQHAKGFKFFRMLYDLKSWMRNSW